MSGAGSATTTTDASGNYTFAALANGAYTITPANSGYTFTPGSLAVTVNGANVTGQNFTAAVTATPTYTISGTATLNGTALADATLTLSGAGSATTTTDVAGNYTFAAQANGAYTVTPAKSGYTFTPGSLAVTVNGANMSGQNFTAALTETPTYTISGTATFNGSALADATITLSGAGSATTTTDASGNYTFASRTNGAYTVTPSKAGYTFTPGSLAVTVNGANQTGQNFSATLVVIPTYAISGTVTASGSALVGATMTMSGASSATTTTDASGSYTFAALANGAYTVTPAKQNYTFSPSNLAVTVAGGNQTGKNFAATVSFNNASLSGDYATVDFGIGGNTVPVSWRNSGYSALTLDGSGGFYGTRTSNDSRSGAIQAETNSGSYTISSSGLVTFTNHGVTSDGALNAAGDIVVVADVRKSTERHISVVVKKGASGFSNSSLNGKYYFSFISHKNTRSAMVEFGTFNFDGAGNYTQSGTMSTLGGTANVGDNASGTYSVNPDGTFTLNADAPTTGIIKDTGDVWVLPVLTGGSGDTTEQLIMYSIKAGGNTHTKASLNGKYYLNNLEINSSPNETCSCSATFDFDGSGGYSGTGQCSPDSGTTPRPSSFSGAYSVNPDGTFTFSTGGQTYDCALSQDGKSVVFAAVKSSAGVSMGFGVKK